MAIGRPKKENAVLLSARITGDCMDLLQSLAQHYGVSKTAVLEIAIRKLARSEGIDDKKTAD